MVTTRLNLEHELAPYYSFVIECYFIAGLTATWTWLSSGARDINSLLTIHSKVPALLLLIQQDMQVCTGKQGCWVFLIVRKSCRTWIGKYLLSYPWRYRSHSSSPANTNLYRQVPRQEQYQVDDDSTNSIPLKSSAWSYQYTLFLFVQTYKNSNAGTRLLFLRGCIIAVESRAVTIWSVLHGLIYLRGFSYSGCASRFACMSLFLRHDIQSLPGGSCMSGWEGQYTHRGCTLLELGASHGSHLDNDGFATQSSPRVMNSTGFCLLKWIYWRVGGGVSQLKDLIERQASVLGETQSDMWYVAGSAEHNHCLLSVTTPYLGNNEAIIVVDQ